eukprot:2758620-Prymnesium_polylepis.1
MRVVLLLRGRLALLTARRQPRQRRLGVLVIDLRVARSPPNGYIPSRKRTHPQPLRMAMRLHLLLESLDRRWCERMVLLCVPTRGSAAAPSAALSVTRRSDGASAQTHLPSSSSCGSGGAR